MRNKTLAVLIVNCLLLIGIAGPVKAGTVISIQTLPSYINYRDFKLSCTSDSTSVKFSVSKHGGGAVTFATINPTSGCVVQITSAQIPEETDYTFTVTDNDNPVLISSTSTIFDNSGPSPVSGYYKDGLSDGYRLHWRNSSSADFDKVIIYRGDTPEFSADSSHEIATVMGSPDSLMTYEDHSGPNKYYDIRALDHAGNSSGLVGDGGGTTTIVTTPSPVAAGGSQVIIVPETGGGSILGLEASPSPEPTATPKANIVEQVNEFAAGTSEPFKWVLTHKKISLGILLTLAAATYIVLGIIKKKK